MVPHFFVNPTAAGGRAGRWWDRARPVLQRHFPGMRWTEAAPTDQKAFLAEAVREGRLVVGVGGDGTHHTLINTLVRNELTDGVIYAPLPVGSGNDWCRTLGIPRHLLRWIEVVKRGRTIHHRIGRLTYRRVGTGEVAERYFINVAGLAYDAEVVRRSDRLPLRHGLLYPLLTAAYLPGYRPPLLQLTYDGTTVTGQFHTINLGIGRYNGGGMRLVPQADPTADTVALTYAKDLPLGRIAANGWRFFTGSIGRVAGVTTTHARRVTVTGSTGLEADGEWLGRGPVEIALTGYCICVLTSPPPRGNTYR